VISKLPSIDSSPHPMYRFILRAFTQPSLLSEGPPNPMAAQFSQYNATLLDEFAAKIEADSNAEVSPGFIFGFFTPRTV